MHRQRWGLEYLEKYVFEFIPDFCKIDDCRNMYDNNKVDVYKLFDITKEEKEFIESRFDSKILKNIYKEINSDNDYQRIQKVMVYTYQKNYLSHDLDNLLKEIKELLLCDGKFDATEQALYHYLKKIFKI